MTSMFGQEEVGGGDEGDVPVPTRRVIQFDHATVSADLTERRRP
ncbi:hypothetical protein ACFU8W_21075 [Streptomyces sp. NPDC057565]